MSRILEFDLIAEKFYEQFPVDSLKTLLLKGENIDQALLKYVLQLDKDEDTAPFIGLQSIKKFKKTQISAITLDLIIRTLDKIVQYDNLDSLQFSMVLSEGLPFTKLYLDLDCVSCKENLPHPDVYTLQMEFNTAIELLINLVGKHLGAVSYFITSKKDKPYCGVHIFFMANIDVVSKHLLMRALMACKLPDRFRLDKTTNTCLPLTRKHVILRRGVCNSGELQYAKWNLQTLRELTYVDVWNIHPFNYSISPVKKEETLDFSNFFIMILKRKDEIIKTLFYPKLEIISTDDNTTTYDHPEIAKVNYDHLAYRDTKEEYLKTIDRNAIRLYCGKLSTTKQLTITFEDVKEFYQQMPRLLNQSPKKTLVAEPMDVDTLEDDDDEYINLSDFKDLNDNSMDSEDSTTKNQYQPYLNYTIEELENIDKILSNGRCRFTKTEANILEGAFHKDLEDFEKLYVRIHLENIEDVVELIPKILVPNDEPPATKKKRKAPTAVDPTKVVNRNLVFNAKDTILLNSFNYAINHLIPMALGHGYTLSVVSYIHRMTTWKVSRIVQLLIYNYCLTMHPTSLFILGRLSTLNDEHLNTFFVANFIGNPFMYILFHNVVSGIESTIELSKVVHAEIEKQCRGKVRPDFVQRFILKNIICIRRIGELNLTFNGVGYRKQTAKAQHLELMKSLDIDSLAEVYNVEPYQPPNHALSYSHYTHMGIFNAVFGVYEPADPTLNSLIIRINKDFHRQDPTTLTVTPAQYLFYQNLHFKIFHLIEYLRNNVLGFTLLAPIFCPRIDPHLYMNPTIDFEFNTSNAQASDLNGAVKLKWPSKFLKELTTTRGEFGEMFHLFMGMLGIIDEKFYLYTDRPMQFLLILLGRTESETAGVPPYTLKEGVFSFKIKKNTAEEMEGINDDENKPLNFDNIDGVNVNRFTEDVVDSIFFENLNNYIKSLKSDTTDVVESIEAAGVDLTSPLKRSYKLSKTTKNWPNKADLRTIFQFVVIEEDFEFDFKDIQEEYLKFAVVLFSWLLRMGDYNAYADTTFFKLLKSKRNIVYNQFRDVVLRHYKDIRVDSIVSLADIIKEFDDTHDLDYSTIAVEPIYFTRDLNAMNYIKNHKVAQRIVDAQPPNFDFKNDEKQKIYTLVAYFLTFSNYNYDNYIEITKFSGSAIYPTNYNKKFVNFFGSSNAGKSGFTQAIQGALGTVESENVLSPRYSSANNQENNVNAHILGRSLVGVLDDPPDKARATEVKKDVNVTPVTTRGIKCDAREIYQITSKFLVTSNNQIVCLDDDDHGFNTRMYPVHLRHAFCTIRPVYSRTFDAALEGTSDILSVQLLISKYPKGTALDNRKTLALAITNFYSRFYFHSFVFPTSETMTATIASTLHRYLSVTSPYYCFNNSVKIVHSDQAMSYQEISEIIEKWLESKHQFAQRVKSSGNTVANLTRKIANDLNSSDSNGKYFVSFIR